MIIIAKCDRRRKKARIESMLMKRDQLAVERGLSIIHVLQVSKRGSGTLLKHKRSRCEAPLFETHLTVSCLTLNADKLAFNDPKTESPKSMSKPCAAPLSRSDVREG